MGMFPKNGGFIASTLQILINEVIPAFYLMHGLYTTGHKVPKGYKQECRWQGQNQHVWEGKGILGR